MDKKTMNSNGIYHFHKGHYLENNKYDSLSAIVNEELSKIQNEDIFSMDSVYTDAWLFLHGSCQLFSLALHEEFGYKVFEIRDVQDRMVHVFCKSTYKGQDVFIDVRGVTTDCVECFSEFTSYLRKGYYITMRNIKKDKRLEDDGDKTGYIFAKDIIKKYREYYDVTM